MNLEVLDPRELKEIFLSDRKLIDVRAPVEYLTGSLPQSTNLPILFDDERAQVGTTYKSNGPEAAVLLGHKLVSGAVKEKRIEDWIQFAKANPETILYCFRGGQRSQIAQTWLQDAGIRLPRLKGGYKEARQCLMSKITSFSTERNVLPLAGPTGSGKTLLIQSAQKFYPTIDLEYLAKHRGSAFGAWTVPQPAQIDFENTLAVEMLRIEKNFKAELDILIEDESRLIGRSVVPDLLFVKINTSPVILVKEDLKNRVENIFDDYIIQSPITKPDRDNAIRTFQKYKNSLFAITKKLGGERTQEVSKLLNGSENDFLNGKGLDSNRDWIEKLLVYYYDPMYLSSLKRREVKVMFEGSRSECLDYLKSKTSLN